MLQVLMVEINLVHLHSSLSVFLSLLSEVQCASSINQSIYSCLQLPKLLTSTKSYADQLPLTSCSLVGLVLVLLAETLKIPSSYLYD